jgi:thiol-disulfide isomerase/thioredoxin
MLLSCSSQEGQQVAKEAMYKYRITATVKNCEGCEVMMKTKVHRDFQRIDSAVVKDGSFILEGDIPESGFYSVTVHGKKKFISADVYLPVDSIHLTIDAESPLRPDYFPRAVGSRRSYLVSSSSPVQAEVDRYIWKHDSLRHKFLEDKELVLEQFRQTYDSGDRALVQLWADSVESFGERYPNYLSYATDLFMREGASPEAALYAMMDSRNDRMATYRFLAYLAALPEEYQQSLQGQYLQNYLLKNEQPNRNNQRFVNSRIRSLDLKGSTPAGIEVDDSELFKANKLTLVEFWASWCSPCRMEMPKQYELYEQYKDKGLGFVAISLDNRREVWLKAIEQDGLEIHHVSELKGSKGDDMRRFEIKNIPANMLVDDTGKIIAVDINSADLRNKLQESLL